MRSISESVFVFFFASVYLHTADATRPAASACSAAPRPRCTYTAAPSRPPISRGNRAATAAALRLRRPSPRPRFRSPTGWAPRSSATRPGGHRVVSLPFTEWDNGRRGSRGTTTFPRPPSTRSRCRRRAPRKGVYPSPPSETAPRDLNLERSGPSCGRRNRRTSVVAFPPYPRDNSREVSSLSRRRATLTRARLSHPERYVPLSHPPTAPTSMRSTPSAARVSETPPPRVRVRSRAAPAVPCPARRPCPRRTRWTTPRTC